MKVYPSKDQFLKYAKKGNIIPVYVEILADTQTPVSAFLKIKDKQDYAYLLESAEIGEKIGRYSFIGVSAAITVSSKGSNIKLKHKNQIPYEYEVEIDPIDEVKKIMGKYKFVADENLARFCGGFVGYLSYDVVRFFENIPDKNPDDLNMPDMFLMLSDTILIFDNVNHTIKIVCNVILDKDASLKDKASLYNAAIEKINSILKKLSRPVYEPLKSSDTGGKECKSLEIKSNFTQSGFKESVIKIKEYIKKGDIIQAVMSQRFETEFDGSAFNIYRTLRSINPSPYMFFIKIKDITLVGSSPEILVRNENKNVEIRPIAGTRKRGKDDEEDKRLEQELLADPKEIAEHVMLVDLARNDIGRVCDYGSVKVQDKMIIERYSHVMHIVSSCVGKLSKNKDCFDLFKATFPAGTVSGAPKVRAMQIIDEVENTRRGIYSGCVGYFSLSGNMDMCITIRTIILKSGKAYVQAGAGIVADSIADSEYKETKNKAQALLKAIKIARGVK